MGDEPGYFCSCINAMAVSRAEFDAQSLELQAVREAATLAHGLLGALRPIDLQHAGTRDAVGAAYMHLDAALKQSRGAT